MGITGVKISQNFLVANFIAYFLLMKMNCSLNFDSNKVHYVLLVHSSLSCSVVIFFFVLGWKFCFLVKKVWDKIVAIACFIGTLAELGSCTFYTAKNRWNGYTVSILSTILKYLELIFEIMRETWRMCSLNT